MVKQGDVARHHRERSLPGRGRSGEGHARQDAGRRRRGRGAARAPAGRRRSSTRGSSPARRSRRTRRRSRHAKADVDAGAAGAARRRSSTCATPYVRAPIAGVIQTRTVQAGQYLQPGAVLATLLQRDPLLLRFQVTEQDAPRIKPGMTANAAGSRRARARTTPTSSWSRRRPIRRRASCR